MTRFAPISYILPLLLGASSIVAKNLRAPSDEDVPEDLRRNFPLGDVPGNYIVKLKPGADSKSKSKSIATRAKGRVKRTYKSAMNGFLLEAQDLDPASLLAEVLKDESVESVVPDGYVHATSVHAEQALSWGLDRIDSPRHIRRDQADRRYTYRHTGTGVHAFILDTGLRTTHEEFQGRIGSCTNFVPDEIPEAPLPECWDGNWHGTLVTSILGGKTYGVAKNVTIHAVRVLDDSGAATWGTILEGLDYAVSKCRDEQLKCVVNMSLTGLKINLVNDVVLSVAYQGLVVVTSAGNNGDDCDRYSPGSASSSKLFPNPPDILTVGATQISCNDTTNTCKDEKTVYSNFGTCVYMWAPGSSITGAGIDSDNATRISSGTSFASPHVAGAAALVIEKMGDSFRANGGLPAVHGVTGELINSAFRLTISMGTNTKRYFLQTTAAACGGGEVCYDGLDATDDICYDGECCYVPAGENCTSVPETGQRPIRCLVEDQVCKVNNCERIGGGCDTVDGSCCCCEGTCEKDWSLGQGYGRCTAPSFDRDTCKKWGDTCLTKESKCGSSDKCDVPGGNCCCCAGFTCVKSNAFEDLGRCTYIQNPSDDIGTCKREGEACMTNEGQCGSSDKCDVPGGNCCCCGGLTCVKSSDDKDLKGFFGQCTDLFDQ